MNEIIQETTEVKEGKPVAVLLYPPQTPHALAWECRLGPHSDGPSTVSLNQDTVSDCVILLFVGRQ